MALRAARITSRSQGLTVILADAEMPEMDG
jgi:hypothetical protein